MTDAEMSAGLEPTEGASARGGLLNGGATVIGTGLAFAMTFVITNTWGAASTGVFFGAVAAFMIAATAMKLGAETALVLFISRLVAEGESGSRRAVRIAIGPVLVASIAAGAALWALAEPLADVFTDTAFSDDFRDVLRVLAWFVPAWSVSLCLLGATRGAGTMRPTAYGLQFLQPAAQFGLVAWAARSDASLEALAWAWAIPIGVTAIGSIIAVAFLLPGGPTSDSVTARAFWNYAAMRGVAGTLQMALDRVGVLIVGAVASAAVAGQWSSVARIVGVAARVFHAIGQALNPRISALAGRRDWTEVSSTVDRISQWTMLLLAPGMIGLACFPEAVLGLFGDDFTPAATALRIAALVMLAASVLAHADNVLLMAGDSRQAMLNTLMALVAAALLYVVLPPSLDAAGAAIAFAVGVAVYRVSAAFQIRAWFGVTTIGPLARTATLAALFAAGPPLIIGRLVGDDDLATATVSGGVALVVFAAALAQLRRSSRIELTLS